MEVSWQYIHKLALSAITESVLDNAADQVLKFAINGETEAADLAELEAEGYTVTFNATKNVLDDGAGNPTYTNTTGAVLHAPLGVTEFDYEVVITKDETTISSETVTVTVLDGTDFAEITGYTITYNTDIVNRSGKIEMNDVAPTIGNVKGTLINGTKDQTVPAPTFKSSNNLVALIDSTTGVITPVAPGTVTFTITQDNATLDVPVQIVDGARKVSTVTADVTSIDITTASAGKEVTLTLVDQYGDPIKADLPVIAAVNNANGDPITNAIDPLAATIDATSGDATVTITIVPQGTNMGSGNLEVKDGNGNVLLTIPVTVGDGTTVAYRKLDTSAADNVIDAKSGATDNTITLYYNKYNSDNQLIGTETDIEDETDWGAETYKVTTSDATVASVAVDPATGAITVTAVAEGTATIKVMEGAITRDSYTVQVIDTTPVLTNVTFDEKAAITAAGPYPLSNVIIGLADAEGNELYLQTDDKINTAADGSGIEVGSVTFVTIDWQSVKLDANGNIQYGDVGTEADPASGDSGIIIVKVLNGSGETVGMYELVINIP